MVRVIWALVFPTSEVKKHFIKVSVLSIYARVLQAENGR